MFPSINTNNPFEFLFKTSPSLFDYQTPTQDLDDSFFLNFPSPFSDEHESPLNQILSQSQTMVGGIHHHHVIDNHVQKNDSDLAAKKGKSAKRSVVVSGSGDGHDVPIIRRRNLGAVPRKRTGKKDRHSKICTAQGIRDRRMRLSLQVARKFFDLQDMLGYDKASKTIEWLFTNSRKAIKELVNEGHPVQANDVNICYSEAKSESFVSEYEVVSGIEENSNMEVEEEGILPPTNLIPLCISPCETRDHEIKPRKKAANRADNMRESRDKARARARCRTREKMMIKGLEFSSHLCKSVNPNHDSSNNPFEDVDQELGSINQERVLAYGDDFTSLERQLADVGTIEKLLKGSSSSSSRSCPNILEHYNHCPVLVSSCVDSNFMGLIGNMDLMNNHNMNSSKYSVSNQVSFAGSSSNSPFEGVDQESDSCKPERVSKFGADVGTLEKLLEINSSSSITCPNGINNNFMGFHGNWDIFNNIDRLNSSSSVTDHLSLAGNPNSIYSSPVNPN